MKGLEWGLIISMTTLMVQDLHSVIRGHSLSFVVIRGHSCVLLDMIDSERYRSKRRLTRCLGAILHIEIEI